MEEWKVKHRISRNCKTHLTHVDGAMMKINDAYKLVIQSKLRNQQIIEDATDCLEKKRTPLVLTKSREHADYLYEHLQDKTDHIFCCTAAEVKKKAL